MTLENIQRVCPLMAAETDTGMDAPATGLTPESGRDLASAFLALRFSLAALDR